MFKVIKKFEICYGHRLLGYDGPCKNFHGHNSTIEVCVSSETLDKLGMVVDFSVLKRDIGEQLKRSLDHGSIVNDKDVELMNFLDTSKEGKAKCLKVVGNPTAEVIGHGILRFCRGWAKAYNESILNTGEIVHMINIDFVRMYETDDNYVEVN